MKLVYNHLVWMDENDDVHTEGWTSKVSNDEYEKKYAENDGHLYLDGRFDKENPEVIVKMILSDGYSYTPHQVYDIIIRNACLYREGQVETQDQINKIRLFEKIRKG